MKNVLENYLFLLTEDPEMDRLDKEYKQARAKVFKYGKGPEGADALSAKYANTPRNEIPHEHKKVMDEYRKAVEEFSNISNKKSKYSEWVRNGKKGSKPESSNGQHKSTNDSKWEGFRNSDKKYDDWKKDYDKKHNAKNDEYWEEVHRRAEEIRRKQEREEQHRKQREEWRKRKVEEELDRIEKEYLKKERLRAKKIAKNIRIIFWSVIVADLLKYSYKIYKFHYSKAAKACSNYYGYEGSRKEICMLEFKDKALINQREVLIKGLNECAKTNDPKKCKEELRNKIVKINKKIKKNTERIVYLKNLKGGND